MVKQLEGKKVPQNISINEDVLNLVKEIKKISGIPINFVFETAIRRTYLKDPDDPGKGLKDQSEWL